MFKLQVRFFFKILIFTGYSIITIEFPENQDKYLGWAEAATGVGLVMGPALGSFIYSFLGYMFTFIAFGILLMIGMILIFFLLPASVNHGQGRSNS